jgi:hypothetical protein
MQLNTFKQNIWLGRTLGEERRKRKKENDLSGFSNPYYITSYNISILFSIIGVLLLWLDKDKDSY